MYVEVCSWVHWKPWRAPLHRRRHSGVSSRCQSNQRNPSTQCSCETAHPHRRRPSGVTSYTAVSIDELFQVAVTASSSQQKLCCRGMPT